MADALLARLVSSTLAVATTGCVWIVIAVAERPRAPAPERALAPLPTVEPRTRVAPPAIRARRPVPLARTRASR